MKWQDINKKLLAVIATTGFITLAMLFSSIDELAGVEVTYHTPSEVCQNCTAEIHVNTTYWEICFEYSDKEDVIYKKQSRSRRLWVNLNKIAFTQPPIKTEVFVPTYGNKLRPIKDGDCLERYNKYHTSVNKIYIYGEPEGELVKWGVPFLDVDPVWVGYEYLYKKVESDVSEVIKESRYIIINNTTGKEEEKVDYLTIFEQHYTKVKDGVKIAGKEYNGDYNVVDDKLISWTVEQGDRNLIEYGSCRKYEIDKGVCIEKKIIGDVVKLES